MGAHTVKIEPEVLEEQNDTKDLLGEIGFQKARYDLNHKTTMIVGPEPVRRRAANENEGQDAL